MHCRNAIRQLPEPLDLPPENYEAAKRRCLRRPPGSTSSIDADLIAQRRSASAPPAEAVKSQAKRPRCSRKVNRARTEGSEDGRRAVRPGLRDA